MTEKRNFDIAITIGWLIFFVALIVFGLMGCGDVTAQPPIPDASTDTVTSTDSVDSADLREPADATLSCVPGCVPICGTSADSTGCRACPTVDGGAPVMACGPQGFQVCCRYDVTGVAYCSGKVLCQ